MGLQRLGGAERLGPFACWRSFQKTAATALHSHKDAKRPVFDNTAEKTGARVARCRSSASCHRLSEELRCHTGAEGQGFSVVSAERCQVGASHYLQKGCGLSTKESARA